MMIRVHEGDLPDLSAYGDVVAVDTETLGLNPHRDRLCVVQISRGDGSADDVSPRYKVALSVTGYDLYLVSGASGHCLEFTSDLDSATGIVIAEQVADE